jgi:histidinol-phosphate aminotransferase
MDRSTAPQAPPSARPEVENLHTYSAPLEGRRGLLRLDFNENTLGPSPLVVEAIRAVPADHYAIYPEYNGLREALLANLTAAGLPVPLAPAQVGLFNGVDAAIHATFHAYGAANDLLLTTSPSFGYYTPCAQMQGMAIEAIPYEGDEFRFPLEAIRSALTSQQPRLLLLCNPNNPTGSRLAPHHILELAALAPHTLIVVDELYEAFTGDSVLPLADFQATPNLLVLRSLAKTAGLAGLRMGFAIGAAPVVERLERVTGPYDINSFAVTAAFAALKDQAYVDGYVAEVLRAKGWLEAQLRATAVRHHSAGGNYLLIWPKLGAAAMETGLRHRGILVRSMAGKPLLDGALRVSVGTLSQMQQFWAAYGALEGLAAPLEET